MTTFGGFAMVLSFYAKIGENNELRPMVPGGIKPCPPAG
jgi:hypothetical protein